VRVHRWPSIEVEVVSLALDPQNVRLDITERSQAAIIQDLFLNEEAFKLAESISRSGFFNNDLPVAWALRSPRRKSPGGGIKVHACTSPRTSVRIEVEISS
jgi:hypothetical protein